jgi:glycosyltransferase involved in cell wall biosynthesis
MRFLFNSSYYWPAYQMGGPIHSVAGLSEELVRRGHEVTVVVCDRDVERMDVDLERGAERNGVRIRYFEAAPTLLQRTRIPAFSQSAAYRFGPEFDRWVSDNVGDFDVIHSQISFLYATGPLSREAARRNKVYLYSQRSNLDPAHLAVGRIKKRVYLELIEKPALRRADVLIALNEQEIESYRALRCRQRIEVIPNGIDPAFAEWPARPEVDPEVGELLERLDDRPVFLLMSRLHPEKGPHIFADAFARVAREIPDAVALYAGIDEEGLVEGEILPAMRRQGLEDRVLYLGPVRGDTRLALLRRCDALVQPTLAEGFSMAILEAMICGCAVLTTPGARFPAIADARAGLIVERTADAVARAMVEMAEGGRERMRRMGERGRQLILEQYSWNAIAARYEELCRELVLRKGGSS